jgi:hypothetical protein
MEQCALSGQADKTVRNENVESTGKTKGML